MNIEKTLKIIWQVVGIIIGIAIILGFIVMLVVPLYWVADDFISSLN